MKRTIAANELVTPSGVLESPIISVCDGRIEKISSRRSETTARVDDDFPGCTITPGFFDIHFHGAGGHDVMECHPDALQTVARYLARAGVTRFLPTTVTASLDATLSALDRMADFIEVGARADAAEAVGIHIEGPFLFMQSAVCTQRNFCYLLLRNI
jgi:N-acetylglucosamine-6-phosphate deacetylase